MILFDERDRVPPVSVQRSLPKKAEHKSTRRLCPSLPAMLYGRKDRNQFARRHARLKVYQADTLIKVDLLGAKLLIGFSSTKFQYQSS